MDTPKRAGDKIFHWEIEPHIQDNIYELDNCISSDIHTNPHLQKEEHHIQAWWPQSSMCRIKITVLSLT